MNYTFEKQGSKGILHCQFDAETVEQAKSEAYKKDKKKIRIPGYRPGKAPRFMIERIYGSDIFLQSALQDLGDKVIGEAIEAGEYTPLEAPNITKVDTQDDNSIVMDITATVVPDVELGEYKNLEIDIPKHQTVDEKEVDHAVEAELRKHTRTETITDRPAQLGDIVDMDYAGTIDGVAFEGGTGSTKLEIGSGRFIPGFEDGLVGMSVDEEKDISVTFPENYGKEELNGKPAVFHVNVHGITREEIPELTDEFISDISEFSTVDEFRKDMADKLQKQMDDELENYKLNAVISKAMQNAKVDIPEVMIAREADNVKDEYERELRGMGMTLENFVKANGMTMENFTQAQILPVAHSNVLADMVMQAIIKKENVELTEDEVKEGREAQMKRFGLKEETLSDDLKARLDEIVQEEGKKQKAGRLMMESAVFHEVDMSASAKDEAEETEESEEENKSEE